MTAIGERERELQAITNKLLVPGPGSLRATLDELRTSSYRQVRVTFLLCANRTLSFCSDKGEAKGARRKVDSACSGT
jgi:hypothetical protein